MGRALFNLPFDSTAAATDRIRRSKTSEESRLKIIVSARYFNTRALGLPRTVYLLSNTFVFIACNNKATMGLVGYIGSATFESVTMNLRRTAFKNISMAKTK